MTSTVRPMPFACLARALAVAVCAAAPVILSACSPSAAGCAARGCGEGFVCVESGRGEFVCADTRLMCGGIQGLTCPQGYKECVDNPGDTCDPSAGDMDCLGLCVPPFGPSR